MLPLHPIVIILITPAGHMQLELPAMNDDILPMFAFGLFTRRQTTDRYAAYWWINKVTGYKFGYELLMLNGTLTFVGLMLLSITRNKKAGWREQTSIDNK